VAELDPSETEQSSQSATMDSENKSTLTSDPAPSLSEPSGASDFKESTEGNNPIDTNEASEIDSTSN
jgi:hypothetical protein